jgi:protoporphyrinogen oxidase
MSGADAPARAEIAVNVAIVGAGPAGLTAGYLLAKAGKRVAIVEKDPARVGGISRTVEHEGHRFDIGGRHLSPKSPAVVELWNEILPGGFIEHSRTSRIYHDGKLYSCPPRVLEALRGLGVWRSAACMMSYAWAKLFPIRDVRSVADWTSNRFGRKLHALIFKAYAEKVWGTQCDQISADWAAERLSGLSLRGAAADVLLRPRPGVGTMWEAARDRIVERGGIFLMGYSLKQLASDGQGGWRMTATGPDGEAVIIADHAISSAPMRELAARLYPLPVSTIEASRLNYRDLLTVELLVRSDQPFPDTCVYIHGSKVQAGRARSLRASPPGTGPDEGVACVALEYFCREGDALWSMRDDRLIELARRELDVLGLVSSCETIGGTVVRQEKAYPVYDSGYAARVEAMRRELAGNHPTLHLVGRTGTHRCGDMEHAMLTAMLTVEKILAGPEYREDAERPLPEACALHPVSEDQAAAATIVRELPRRAGSASPAPRKKVA